MEIVKAASVDALFLFSGFHLNQVSLVCPGGSLCLTGTITYTESGARWD